MVTIQLSGVHGTSTYRGQYFLVFHSSFIFLPSSVPSLFQLHRFLLPLPTPLTSATLLDNLNGV